jgi:hypothetical protein
MRTAQGLLAAVAAALFVAGCGLVSDPGPLTAEQRVVEGVHAVQLDTSGELSLASGSTAKLTITADVMS